MFWWVGQVSQRFSGTSASRFPPSRLARPRSSRSTPAPTTLSRRSMAALAAQRLHDDLGATWTEHPGGSGGSNPHADAVLALDDRVIRVPGSLGEKEVWG